MPTSNEKTSSPLRSKRYAGPVVVGALAFVLVLALGVVAGVWWKRLVGPQELSPALRERGKLLVIGPSHYAGQSINGTQTVAETDSAEIAQILDGSDEFALHAMLREEGFQGILVGPFAPAADPNTLREALLSYAPMAWFEAEIVTQDSALFVPSTFPAIDELKGATLAKLVRRLLEGSAPPPIRNFPEAFVAPTNVEILVILRQDGRPRLWRSARGSSIARALITASKVAADRWREREQSMGGPLDELLPLLDVEVWRIYPDGYIDDRHAQFVEQVFYFEHGVAYEHKASWRYMLPENRAREELSPAAAFSALFIESGESDSSLTREDIRPYRVRVQRLGVSPGIGEP